VLHPAWLSTFAHDRQQLVVITPLAHPSRGISSRRNFAEFELPDAK
jgi:hypothetical protein